MDRALHIDARGDHVGDLRGDYRQDVTIATAVRAYLGNVIWDAQGCQLLDHIDASNVVLIQRPSVAGVGLATYLAFDNVTAPFITLVGCVFGQ